MEQLKKQKKAHKVIRSTTDEPAKRKKGALYCRRKGHGFERTIVNFFKELGFSRAMSTRLGSKIMDHAKIDLCNVPFNIQCKAVEAKIDYTKLTLDIKNEINKLIPERNHYPIIIIHKQNRETQVIFTLEEFEKFMRMHVPVRMHVAPEQEGQSTVNFSLKPVKDDKPKF